MIGLHDNHLKIIIGFLDFELKHLNCNFSLIVKSEDGHMSFKAELDYWLSAIETFFVFKVSWFWVLETDFHNSVRDSIFICKYH